jgi:glycosyltransferase involved in cell wall biosynthesis
MSLDEQPLVSVLTPVYNMGEFLTECIESVLNQNYKNFEYIIVNNRSTDRTLEIAKEYAAKDSRIRVYDNAQFVPVIENHNIAFRLMSPNAKYCKLVCADDFIFPECIARMVELAEAHPMVGIVGCYQLSQSSVRWQGFEYPQTVFPGPEICRRIFLGNDKTFGFGSPTSTMYRADLVRSAHEFYPDPSPHADTSACFSSLRNVAYGFVYQVLSYERIHEGSQSATSHQIDRYSSAYLNDVIRYGRLYLNDEELQRVLNRQLKGYHRGLAAAYLTGTGDKDFWIYHKSRLAELGYPLTRIALFKAGGLAILQEGANPLQAAAKLWRRLSLKFNALLHRTHHARGAC